MDETERRRKFDNANLLAVLAYHKRITAVAYEAAGEGWRVTDLKEQANQLERQSQKLHNEVGESYRRDKEK